MGYKTISFPPMRKLQADVGTVAKQTNSFRALVEMDVTKVRKAIKLHKDQTGHTLSFTGFIAYCLARAVSKHQQVHALRNWWGSFVIFDEVDISILIEREVEGERIALMHVIRAADKKAFQEIHNSIRKAQTDSFAEAAGVSKSIQWWKLFLAIPGFMRRLLWRIMFSNPHLIKKMTGTVSLSAVGMAGKGGGWGIPNANITLSVIVGGIVERPVLENDVLSNHEFLQLTFAFNHDVVDGAPAARFVSHMRDLVEEGRF